VELKEKITLLKSQLAELHSEYIETKSEYNTTKNNLAEILRSLDHSENFELKIKMVKEMISKELEFMRTRTALIRRVSPMTASNLEDLVSKFEDEQNRIRQIFVDRYNNAKEREDKEAVTTLTTGSINLKDPDISDTIDLCLSAIKETLEKLEKSVDQ